MTFLRAHAFLGLAMLLVSGCAEDPQSPTAQDEAAETAIHPAYRFTVTAPLTAPPLESLRNELASSDVGYAWVATEGATFAVRVEPWASRDALGANALRSLVEDAYTFHRRLGDPSAVSAPIRALATLPKTTAGLGGGLDAIGRAPVDGSGDDPATSERNALAHLLDVAASGPRIAVMAGELHDEPDMDWEGVLVVVDLEHGELLFTTGGRGN